jgi:GNAT superfamily N-acetyltransferase
MKAVANVTAAASSVLAAARSVATSSGKKTPVPLSIRSVSLHPHGPILTTPHDSKAEIWPQGSDVMVAHHLGITAYPLALHEGPEVTAALSRAFPQGSLLAFDTTNASNTTNISTAALPLAGYMFCFPAKRGQVHALNDSSESAKVGEHKTSTTSSSSSSSSSSASNAAPADMSLYLHDIAVYPSYEGRGVAQQLLVRFDALSRALSLPYQSLTAIHWRGADVFWKSKGFIPLRTFEYAPDMPATYMERPTPPAPTSASTRTSTATPSTTKSAL